MDIKCKIKGCNNPVGTRKKYCNRHSSEKDNKVKATVGIIGATGATAWAKRDEIIKFCKTNGPKVAKVGMEFGAIAIKKIIK